jgi:hypothetical protein
MTVTLTGLLTKGGSWAARVRPQRPRKRPSCRRGREEPGLALERGAAKQEPLRRRGLCRGRTRCERDCADGLTRG